MQSIDYAFGGTRPLGLSVDYQWPPALDACERHPQSTETRPSDSAFNNHQAVRDFGEEWVAAVHAQQPQFAGDWWLRCLLEGFVRVAQQRDHQGTEATRFEGWLLAVQHLRIPLHLEGSRFLSACLDHLPLEGALITNAHFDSCSLRRAVLKDADARGTKFSECRLDFIDLRGASLDDAAIVKSDGPHADLSGAHMARMYLGMDEDGFLDWRAAQFVGADGAGVLCSRVNLLGSNLSDARMPGARFTNCGMSSVVAIRACLTRAILDRIELRGSQFTDSDLSNASLVAADLTDARLDGANLSGAMLYQANISTIRIARANLIGVRGLFGGNRAMARSHAIDEYEAQNARYRRGPAERLLYQPTNRTWTYLMSDHVSWEWLRVIGGLRLFGVSYLSVAFITAYAGVAGPINEAADHARVVAASAVHAESGRATILSQVLSRAPRLPMPWHLGAQLVATLCVALAATIYVVACPNEVKCADEVTWTRSMGQPLWEYRSAKYARIRWRYTCCILFVFGGLYSIAYIGWRGAVAVRVLLGI